MGEENTQNFIAYEYKEIGGHGERASMLIDCYGNFGWEIDEMSSLTNRGKIILRRNRKIINKAELTRLQRNFEACIKDIDSLKKSIKSKGVSLALTVGLIGTAFMAVSVFAITATPPLTWLCILFAIPGFILWGCAPLTYLRVVEKRVKVVDAQVEEKYEEIFAICEKGNRFIVN
ncbi:MAG: hypothetical protein ACK5LZ_02250 [Anaerorhabdus sp.]